MSGQRMSAQRNTTQSVSSQRPQPSYQAPTEEAFQDPSQSFPPPLNQPLNSSPSQRPLSQGGYLPPQLQPQKMDYSPAGFLPYQTSPLPPQKTDFSPTGFLPYRVGSTVQLGQGGTNMIATMPFRPPPRRYIDPIWKVNYHHRSTPSTPSSTPSSTLPPTLLPSLPRLSSFILSPPSILTPPSPSLSL